MGKLSGKQANEKAHMPGTVMLGRQNFHSNAYMMEARDGLGERPGHWWSIEKGLGTEWPVWAILTHFGYKFSY